MHSACQISQLFSDFKYILFNLGFQTFKYTLVLEKKNICILEYTLMLMEAAIIILSNKFDNVFHSHQIHIV